MLEPLDIVVAVKIPVQRLQGRVQTTDTYRSSVKLDDQPADRSQLMVVPDGSKKEDTYRMMSPFQ
jgi:hypothetical protein